MKIIFACAALAAAMISTPAAADFDGSTVNFQYYFPDSSSAYAFADNGDKVVGPGVEVTDMAFSASMDISATNLLVDFSADTSWTSAAFNGWVLSDLTNNLSAITGVTINPLTNMSGFSASNLIWDADSITVNWQGLSFDPDTFVSLDVAFAQSAVPEPGTWAMMLLGFSAIGFAMRRRKSGVPHQAQLA